jgi:3-phytase
MGAVHARTAVTTLAVLALAGAVAGDDVVLLTPEVTLATEPVPSEGDAADDPAIDLDPPPGPGPQPRARHR